VSNPKRIYYLTASLLFFLSFVFLSLIVHRDLFRNFDYRSMVMLQKLTPEKLDLPFALLTLLASSEVTLFLLLSVFMYLVFRRKHLFLGIFIYMLMYPLELLGKLLIYHPKPPLFFFKNILNLHLPSSYIIQTNYSFPSGHMARTAFLTVILLRLFCGKKSSKLAAYLAIFVIFTAMFYTRIYLGEHWFSDVTGGIFLGFSVGFFSLAFL